MGTEWHWLGIGLVFLLAGGVKGITGMGLPTVAVSLLGLWMLPAQAAALLVVPSLATNLAQCRGPATRQLVAMLWPAWLALAALTVWLPSPAQAPITLDPRLVLGLVLVVYGVWGLARPQLPRLPQRPFALGLPIGAATGALAALTAVFVMPLVPYLQAQRLDKDTMVQALGLSFTVATLALALRLQSVEGLALLTPASALALAAALAGVGLGALVRARISATVFQRALFLVFVGLGVANLWRAL